MIVFRQADARYPFLWSGTSQPAARWHAAGEGPANYFADTPDGAWAELLRHEEIADPLDAATLRRALWAVEIDDEPLTTVSLKPSVLTGGRDTYRACQVHARRLRARGARRLLAPSAALLPGGAAGRQIAGGVERPGAPQDGLVIVIYGSPEGLVGWQAVERGAPPPGVLARVRHFTRSD
ncbi:MAG TPA: RES domain-containing protein [Vicinamibacterales bacterium]|nr:RES domain-containing protein [Vicinamibacterales bacterium]